MANQFSYQLSNMTDELTVFIGIIDLDGKLIFANRAPLENSGVDRDSVINQVFWEGPWFEQHQEGADTIRDAFNGALEGETVVDEILVLLGGQSFWIEMIVHPILDDSGAVRYVVAEGLVIDRRRKVEQELVALNKQLELRVAQRTAELEAANTALRVLGETDHLTQLANRQAYERRLEENIATGKRTQQCLSLLMIDIDQFKQYNDHYGHDRGDVALRSVAEQIARSLPRTTDLSARFGGEEFVVLLPATEGKEALEVANRIRIGVKALAIMHEYSVVCGTVTVSIGVATLIGEALNEHDLLSHADQALYRAKDAGRNCCQRYES
ncbi:MAG: diguanylate cyclase [Immundisolibacteraceae bacterium]|nr:diguanylate cyclase [Immundisolibacteraceae bacterium]